MREKGYSDELERALARSDADKLIRQIDAYVDYFAAGAGDWPEEHSDNFGEILDSHWQDLDKALAYVVLGANRCDSAEFVNFLACSTLEDILENPSVEMIERIVAEARKSPRFRWMLSSPYKVAVSDAAWKAIEPFRITGPHEEPRHDTMPKSYFG